MNSKDSSRMNRLSLNKKVASEHGSYDSNGITKITLVSPDYVFSIHLQSMNKC